MSDSPKVSRRRVLGAIATVGGASAAAGAGTMALFSDTESSSGNTVQAGTLELGFNTGGTFDFATDLAPTQSATGSVTLVNSGSVTGSLDADVSYTENDASPNETDMSADEVAQNLTVTQLDYGGNDLLSGQGLPANPTLADLATNDQTSGESTPNDLVDLADPGGGTQFTITLELADVGNDFQSDGVNVTVAFDLNQSDGQ